MSRTRTAIEAFIFGCLFAALFHWGLGNEPTVTITPQPVAEVKAQSHAPQPQPEHWVANPPEAYEPSPIGFTPDQDVNCRYPEGSDVPDWCVVDEAYTPPAPVHQPAPAAPQLDPACNESIDYWAYETKVEMAEAWFAKCYEGQR